MMTKNSKRAKRITAERKAIRRVKYQTAKK